jgi:hypothetical protein
LAVNDIPMIGCRRLPAWLGRLDQRSRKTVVDWLEERFV